MTEKFSIAETAGKALRLYEGRVYDHYRKAANDPNRQTILAAYGHIIVLRDDITYQHAWLMDAIDAIHYEIVTDLIAITEDAAVKTVLLSDPVIRDAAPVATVDDEVTTEEEEAKEAAPAEVPSEPQTEKPKEAAIEHSSACIFDITVECDAAIRSSYAIAERIMKVCADCDHRKKAEGGA